jgi:hypothetical protein
MFYVLHDGIASEHTTLARKIRRQDDLRFAIATTKFNINLLTYTQLTFVRWVFKTIAQKLQYSGDKEELTAISLATRH